MSHRPFKGVLVCLFTLTAFTAAGSARAELAFIRIPKPIPGPAHGIEIAGSTVTINGITEPANQVFVNGTEVQVRYNGSFSKELIVPLGQTDVIVEAHDPEGRVNRYTKRIEAAENHFFLVGIADGTYNRVDATDNYNLRRDNTSFDDGTHLNGKLSYYLAAKVKGKYLIKSSLDTDKATQEKLFTNIDPDKYYPVYGDRSTVVYDAQSQGKFFLRVDWDDNGLVIGNYQTQIGDDDERSLAQYNRTLYGAKIHLASNETNIYGDRKHRGTFFVAEANQLRGHSELLGTGASLYYLRHRNIIEGSEQVRLEVRDKFSKSVIAQVPQTQNDNYEIKYDEGRILFREPVSSVAPADTFITEGILEGHEVFVVVEYEYKNQDAFPVSTGDLDTVSAGTRISKTFGDHVEVGATYVQEEKDRQNHQMYGVDGEIKIGNFTRLRAELAGTAAESATSYVSYNGGYDYAQVRVGNADGGKALRIEAQSSIGELMRVEKDRMEVSAYYQSVDKRFSPAETLYESGTKKLGLGVSSRISDRNRISVRLEDAYIDEGADNQIVRNDLKASRMQNYVAQWEHERSPMTFVTEYKIQRVKNSLSEVRDPNTSIDTDYLVSERVKYKLSDKTSIFGGVQLGLDSEEDNQLAAGVSRKLTDEYAVNLQGATGQDRNSVLAGIVRQIDARNSEYMNYEVAENATDGKTSSMTLGSNLYLSPRAELKSERQFVTGDRRGAYAARLMNLDYQITPNLYADFSYERREEALDQVLRGSSVRDALSGRLAYAKVDRWEAEAKAEYRTDTGDDEQILWDTSAQWKVNPDATIFGELEYSRGHDDVANVDNSRISKKQLGLAYRPVDFDRLNILFKYIRLKDHRPRDLVSADGGFLKNKSVYDEVAVEGALELPFHFQLVEKAAYRNEHLRAINSTNTAEMPQHQRAYLWINRLNYHLSNKWDVAAEWRRLSVEGSDVNRDEEGTLLEISYQIMDHLALGCGYNFTSFKSNLEELHKNRAEGLYIRAQGKY